MQGAYFAICWFRDEPFIIFQGIVRSRYATLSIALYPRSTRAITNPVANYKRPLAFFSRIFSSISTDIEAKSHFGAQPHSSRAQVSSNELGQLRAILSFTGSTL